MPQSVSIHISLGSQAWVCMGVYACPIYSLRSQLWEYLVDLKGRIGVPWALIGDFNEILLLSEQRGGLFFSFSV